MSYKTIKTLTTWQPFLFKGNFINKFQMVLTSTFDFVLERGDNRVFDNLVTYYYYHLYLIVCA